MSAEAKLRPEHVRAVRLGHGANCSSVGSVIDTLFLGAVAGGAIFAAVCAAVEAEHAIGADADADAGDDRARTAPRDAGDDRAGTAPRDAGDGRAGTAPRDADASAREERE